MNFIRIVNGVSIPTIEEDVDSLIVGTYKNLSFGKMVLLRDGKLELESMIIEIDNSVAPEIEEPVVVESENSEPIPEG